MGYMHIDNLYKNQDVLMFKECYALEKIHGTSAHIGYCPNNGIRFFSGGEKHEKFVKLWGESSKFYKLHDALHSIGADVVVYGEAYGGKCQGMKDTYGDTLRFIAFDVKIGDCWLSVPDAHDVAKECGLEFVDYVKGPTTLEFLDQERDRPSVQAVRNGITEPKAREGIVIRPVIEVSKNSGKRIIAKHKGDNFRETKTVRQVSPEKLKVLQEVNAIAEEWVTEMRLIHVLDKLGNPGIEKMRDIILAMQEDVKREGEGEIVWSKEVEKAIGKATAVMFKRNLQLKLRN